MSPEESPTFVEAWLAMEKQLESGMLIHDFVEVLRSLRPPCPRIYAGKVKAIGVSNFSIKNLDILLSKANIVPAVNQVEIHPCLPNFELVEYCEKKGIHVTAYSPFGEFIAGTVHIGRLSSSC